MFKLPKEVLDGIPAYHSSLERLLSGDISGARFKGIRVPWGIYSQRKGKVNMARIRLPGGVAAGRQLKALAEASRRFSDGVLHVTDRQDIQIHNLPIENTSALMDYLKEYDLSPRGGGGNTVRNITSCPLAGICEKEVFDVKGYAIALTEYMLKDDASFNLPRKYKISFSGCSLDCAHTTVSDVGFIAKTKVINGREAKGFAVYVGGGLGASSRVARLLEDFISVGDVGYTAEAVKRVFNAHGNRRNKHHARLRFLVEDIGFEKFRRLYDEQLGRLKEGEEVKLRRIEFKYPDAGGEFISDGMGDEGFKTFVKHSVTPQKQEGLYTVEVRVRLGDIKAEDLEKLGSIGDHFLGVYYMTSQRQNILICNVPGSKVYPLYKKLEEYDLALPYSSTVLDVVCCAGASTCNLGICDSKAMSFELVKMLEETLDLDKLDRLNDFKINVNGCPNACGHAPIGFIGLTGMTRRIDNRMVPFYRISFGGVVEESKTKLNDEVGVVPARNVPRALTEFLVEAQKNLSPDRDALRYIQSEGASLMKKIIVKYSNVPPYKEDSSFYRDWGKSEDFTLAGIGSGECGAGVMEIIESDIGDAEESIAKAGKDFDAGLVRDVLHLSARALLVVRGIDPKTPEETFRGFVKEIVEGGYCASKFKNIEIVYSSLDNKLGVEEREKKLALAKELLEDVKEAYRLMDNSFNFKKRY